MKIVLITTTTPAAENIRGTSALPYHLMVNRERSVEIDIYSYNINRLSAEQISNVEQKLDVKINLLQQPRWFGWMLRLHLTIIRVLMGFPFLSYMKLPHAVVDRIKASEPDGIWIYGEEISQFVRLFPEYKRVHIGPDSEALYYYRMLGRRFVVKNWKMYWKQAVMYPKYLRLERSYVADKNATYCVVGEEDANFIRNINPGCNVRFLRHPHYDIVSPQKEISFARPRVKLLVAGRYDLYMQQDADELVEALCANSDALAAHFELTFLGKGWEDSVSRLRHSSWTVNHIIFAPDYIEEIRRHDAQLVPISIGTGTKGKVLDAFANGLLVIGTGFALENIAVSTDNESMGAIHYYKPQDVITTLIDITTDRHKYEDMARKGREQMLTAHSRTAIARELFGVFE